MRLWAKLNASAPASKTTAASGSNAGVLAILNGAIDLENQAIWAYTTAAATGKLNGTDATSMAVLAAANMGAIAAQLPGGMSPAWSLSVQLALPYSPHTLSLYATNANTRTLEGMSRGDAVVRYGFEFLIPFRSLGRYAALFSPAAADTEVAIAGYRFQPGRLTIKRGTRVRWRNSDAVAHTVTSDSGLWDSGPIAPGGSFTRRFERPGDYPYRCLPHPFMQAVIHVE